MYDSITDIAKTVTLILAVILPTIGVIYAYRKESKEQKRPTIGQAGLIAIGGALASEGETLQYVEAMHEQSKSMAEQTKALNRLANAMAPIQEEMARLIALNEKHIDEVIKIRRALEEANILSERLRQ